MSRSRCNFNIVKFLNFRLLSRKLKVLLYQSHLQHIIRCLCDHFIDIDNHRKLRSKTHLVLQTISSLSLPPSLTGYLYRNFNLKFCTSRIFDKISL